MTTIAYPATTQPVIDPPRLTRVERRKIAARRLRRRRLVRWTTNVILATVCTLTVVSTVGDLAGWWRADTVLTGSMRPGIEPGDVEILRPEPTAALRVGQIVALRPPKDSFTVSHRIIAVRHGAGRDAGLWITTRGDANNVADPWGSVRVVGPTAWVVAGVVPGVGYLSVWVRQPLLHLMLLAAVVLLICSMAMNAIWRP